MVHHGHENKITCHWRATFAFPVKMSFTVVKMSFTHLFVVKMYFTHLFVVKMSFTHLFVFVRFLQLYSVLCAINLVQITLLCCSIVVDSIYVLGTLVYCEA